MVLVDLRAYILCVQCTWNGLPPLDHCPELEKELKQWSGKVIEASIVHVDHGIKQLLRPAHLNYLHNEKRFTAGSR